jgi:hypothetical protein
MSFISGRSAADTDEEDGFVVQAGGGPAMRMGLGVTVILWLAAAGAALAQPAASPPPVVPPGTAYGGAATAMPDAGAWSRPPAAALDPAPGPYPVEFDPDSFAGEATDRGSSTLGTVTYGSVEYLLWYARKADLPQLVVTYPTAAVGQDGTVSPQFVGGVLGGTGKGTPSGALNGVRVFAGAFLDPETNYAVEAGYFVLPEIQKGFSYGSNGVPLVARSYSDITQNNTSLYIRLASPGDLAGNVQYETDTFMQGFEGNVRVRGLQMLADRVDWLVGFRYIDLDESIRIRDSSVALSPNGAAALAPNLAAAGIATIGSRLSTFDFFKTRNQFYGAQVGASTRFSSWSGRLVLDVIGKVAFGGINQTVRIDGSSTLTNPGGPTLSVGGGSLTGPNNIGRYSDTRFIVVPELTVNGGYRITSNVLAFVGYNALYLQSTQRPGNSIDPGINPSRLPFRGGNFDPSGQPRPGFSFSQTEAFWVQGLNVGLQFTY